MKILRYLVVILLFSAITINSYPPLSPQVRNLISQAYDLSPAQVSALTQENKDRVILLRNVINNERNDVHYNLGQINDQTLREAVKAVQNRERSMKYGNIKRVTTGEFVPDVRD